MSTTDRSDDLSKMDAGSLIQALDLAGVGAWEWNIRTGAVRWSETVERLLGFPRGGLGGSFDLYQTYIHEKDRSRVLDATEAALRDGTGYSLEYRMFRPDRSMHWISTYGKVLPGADGAAEIVMGICTDINEQKQRERELLLQQRVVQIISRQADLPEISSALLQALCESLGWDLGELWLAEVGETELTLADSWWLDDAVGREFVEATHEISFTRGHGIPGTVWETGGLMWVKDLATNESFPRAQIAGRLGLHSAVAFPIMFSTDALGVLVFYAQHVEEHDENLARLLTFIGAQLGQYIDRRRALEVLEASEARYRGLAETATDAILTVDQRGTIIFANHAAERIFGYPIDEILGNSLVGLMPARYREGHSHGFSAFIRSGERRIPWTGVELPGLRKDGTEVALEIAFSEFMLRGERYVTGVARDIAARKRESDALQLLSEASKVFGDALDHDRIVQALCGLTVPRIADWCFVDILAEDGTFRRVASANVDPEKLLREEDLQRLYPTSVDSQAGPATVLRTGISQRARVDREFLSGIALSEDHRSRLEALGLSSFICGALVARGRTLGAITLLTADSAHVYDEFDQSVVEELVARASVALDNARLYSNAQEANQAKDEFLAQLSHELKTPITAVLGYARLLEQGGLDETEVKLAVDSIKTSAEAQARLVEDILDVSRAVMGKFRMDVSPLDLTHVISASVDSVRPAAAAKSITIEIVKECNACFVLGDPNRLQQVAWNLIVNAIKFTPTGGTVTIRLAREVNLVTLDVHDTGAGIAAEFLPHVFDRFAQGQGSQQRGGLGLGLAIVRQLVELHGGTVSVTSAGLGCGASFRVTLPVLLAEQVPPEASLITT